jgi:RNA polymerase sigma-70 factor (ECF subfamily)
MTDLSYKSDEELVKLSLKDSNVFSYIINRYKEKLALYIRRITNISEEETEDVLQDIFIKTYLNLNAYNSSLKFSSWIYRISHNQVISHFRHLKSRPEGYSSQLDETLAERISSDEDLVKDIDFKINKKNILNILNTIDKKYREILVLKFLEEKSYQEISDILKKPQGTVASMMNKAKDKFREEIKKQGINF